jgi:prephenate dehydrogenase
MKICVVGLGLIGGSIAKECRTRQHYIYGVDANQTHQEKAIDFGLVDEIVNIDTALNHADVFIVAIPVDAIENMCHHLLDHISWHQTVFDVGSTKKDICTAIADHPKRSRFIASHPLAGTEFSGPGAAILNLFKGKKNIICEEHKSDEDALEKVLTIFNELGMQSLFMDADSHDKHMAYVSHLSHVSAFTLSLTVLDIEQDQKQIFNLASTGFESTVRLAKSNPDTWASIFDKNSTHLSDALGQYINHLQHFKSVIDSGDKMASKELIEKANEIKRVLNGLKLNVVKLS